MNYKILMDGAIPGYNAGDIIDLSESDGKSLAQWGIVEPVVDEPVVTTAPPPAPTTTTAKTTEPADTTTTTAKTTTTTAK